MNKDVSLEEMAVSPIFSLIFYIIQFDHLEDVINCSWYLKSLEHRCTQYRTDSAVLQLFREHLLFGFSHRGAELLNSYFSPKDTAYFFERFNSSPFEKSPLTHSVIISELLWKEWYKSMMHQIESIEILLEENHRKEYENDAMATAKWINNKYSDSEKYATLSSETVFILANLAIKARKTTILKKIALSAPCGQQDETSFWVTNCAFEACVDVFGVPFVIENQSKIRLEMLASSLLRGKFNDDQMLQIYEALLPEENPYLRSGMRIEFLKEWLGKKVCGSDQSL